jgi:DNA-binding transcriptional regulator LsrR (DeoR family)
VASGSEQRRLKVKIAQKYYLKSETQDAIAKELGLSRIKVQRLLSQCRKEGIVEIRINDPMLRCLELEDELKARFGLLDARVSASPSDSSMLVRDLARVCADYFVSLVSEGCVIGTAWGRTVFQMTQFLEPTPVRGVKVVSLLGGLAPSMAHHPYAVMNRISDVFGAESHYLVAPALADSPLTRDVFMKEKRIQETLDMARNADIVIAGIGDVSEQSTLLLTGYLSQTELEELVARGAVGEMLTCHFDADGKLVPSRLSERLVGLKPDELGSVGQVIGVAGGEVKVRAILGALRARYINVLVTDEDTARKLIEIGP